MGGGLRPFGATGLAVPVLGLGAGPVGDCALDEAEAGRLLHGALDLGLTFVDTAPGYGLSEERIGRHLSSRRSSFVLSTKLGYGVPDVPDWTPECIARGVDQALSRLRTDALDVAHLHSCPLETLLSSGVVEALLGAVRVGKVRVAAYSGENEALAWAISSCAFGSVQCSVNVCDQRSLTLVAARGLGVVAKRPLANAPWNPAAAHPGRRGRRGVPIPLGRPPPRRPRPAPRRARHPLRRLRSRSLDRDRRLPPPRAPRRDERPRRERPAPRGDARRDRGPLRQPRPGLAGNDLSRERETRSPGAPGHRRTTRHRCVVPHEPRTRGASHGSLCARATRIGSAARAGGERANSLRSNSARS